MKISSMLALTFGLAIPTVAPSFAQAADCFILVHGYKSADDLSDKTKALAYWQADGDFTAAVTGSTGHYGIVGWDSKTLPFWHTQAAGSVARQIVSITAGEGDGVAHTRQCTASDKFYVVAHSQGAQVMTYINGNATASDPNVNRAFNTTDLSGMTDLNRTTEPFATAMSKITAVITIGAATNGTEGMDDTCDGGLDAALLGVFGKVCVKSLQTHADYNPSSYTGTAMYRPVYSLGGYGTTPLSLVLSGEDDGVVNLASQMNCIGSPTRDLEKDFKEWSGFWPVFTCHSENKRHKNNFNLASVNITHNAEVGSPSGYFSHHMRAAGALNCGDYKNVPNTIAACLSQTK